MRHILEPNSPKSVTVCGETFVNEISRLGLPLQNLFKPRLLYIKIHVKKKFHVQKSKNDWGASCWKSRIRESKRNIEISRTKICAAHRILSLNFSRFFLHGKYHTLDQFSRDFENSRPFSRSRWQNFPRGSTWWTRFGHRKMEWSSLFTRYKLLFEVAWGTVLSLTLVF